MSEKTYILNVYNTMTGEFELVQVTKEVFQTYRRTKWHIEDSTERFYKHETQMSSLIGGENDGYERFHEFIDYDNTPENQAIEEMVRQSLRNILDLLPPKDYNSLLSIDKNVSLANAGKLGDVEKNAAAFFAGLGTAHVLTPYYGFTMDGVSCLKSIPLRPDAVELYPPHFEVTATAFKMGGRLLPNVDASTFTRAYRTQSPIEFDVTTAQKYLGSIPDPVQHEAEKLTGTHMFLKPPTFPPAFPCSVLIDGETVIDYLLLRTKKIEEDGTIIITNEEQKNFNFTVTLTVNTAVTSLNLSVTPSNPSNIESLKYRYFLRRAISAHRIDLKSLEHNKCVFYCFTMDSSSFGCLIVLDSSSTWTC